MKQGLALARMTIERALGTRVADLSNVSPHRPPAFDLAFVVERATSHMIPAVPLEPPARIVGINPAFFSPHGEWLRRVDLEKVEFRVVAFGAELRVAEPGAGKLIPAVRHVLAAENAEPEHFRRRKLGLEPLVEVPPNRLRAVVDEPALHAISDDDSNGLHPTNLCNEPGLA